MGKLSSSTLGVYEGTWEKDMRHGRGKLTYPNGDVYEGDWELNKVCMSQGVQTALPLVVCLIDKVRMSQGVQAALPLVVCLIGKVCVCSCVVVCPEVLAALPLVVCLIGKVCVCTYIGYTMTTKRFSVSTKPLSGSSITGLYHRMSSSSIHQMTKTHTLHVVNSYTVCG